MAEFFEVMKEMAAFLNSNPKAKALMEDPQTKSLSESEFAAKLMAIALEADAERTIKSLT